MVNMSLRDIKREVYLPKEESTQLAEFFGIITGDGYMNCYGDCDYVVEIAGNKLLDKPYLFDYVANLIKSLFGLAPCFIERKDQNSIYLRIRSKAVYEYLINKNFKKGRKEQIDIPSWILRDKEFIKYFVRGFFDTDGCISIKNKEGSKYPTLSLSSKSFLLIKSINNYLNYLEISNCLIKDTRKDKRFKKETTVYKLEINGHKTIEKFMGILGSSNNRNLSKYDEMQAYQKGLKKS